MSVEQWGQNLDCDELRRIKTLCKKIIKKYRKKTTNWGKIFAAHSELYSEFLF